MIASGWASAGASLVRSRVVTHQMLVPTRTGYARRSRPVPGPSGRAGQRLSSIVAKSGWPKLNMVVRLPIAGRFFGTYASGVGFGRLSVLLE